MNRARWKLSRLRPCSIEGWNNDARSIAAGIRRSLIGHRSGVDASRAATGDRDKERRKDALSGSLLVRDVNKVRASRVVLRWRRSQHTATDQETRRRGFSTRGWMRGEKAKDRKIRWAQNPGWKLFVSRYVSFHSSFRQVSRTRIYGIGSIRSGRILTRRIASRTCTAVRQLDAMGSRRI